MEGQRQIPLYDSYIDLVSGVTTAGLISAIRWVFCAATAAGISNEHKTNRVEQFVIQCNGRVYSSIYVFFTPFTSSIETFETVKLPTVFSLDPRLSIKELWDFLDPVWSKVPPGWIAQLHNSAGVCCRLRTTSCISKQNRCRSSRNLEVECVCPAARFSYFWFIVGAALIPPSSCFRALYKMKRKQIMFERNSRDAELKSLRKEIVKSFRE